jgi:serine/threonine-protein kinase RsbW
MKTKPFSFLKLEDFFVIRDRLLRESMEEQSSQNGDSSPPLTASGRVWAGTATVRTKDDVASVLQILLDALQRNHFPAPEIEGIRLAVNEAIVNALRHGHQGDASKQVRIRYLINHVGLLAQVEDEGPGFRPDWILNPPNPEARVEGQGRGLRLMLEHMTEVRYNATGNCVTLLKHRPPSA